MVKQLLKIIWKQRNKNIWIILEIFLVFILMWCIVDPLVVLGITKSEPVGIDIQNVYRVKLSYYQQNSPNYIHYEEGGAEAAENFLRIIERLKQHPSVENVTYTQWFAPYFFSDRTSRIDVDSVTNITINFIRGTSEFFKVFAIADNITFEQDRDIVMTKTLEDKLFPEGAVLGKDIYIEGDSSNTNRLIGVVNPIKKHDFVRYHYFVFTPILEYSLYGEDEWTIWRDYEIFIRTKSNINEKEFPHQFKEEIKNQLKAGNFFLSEIIPFKNIRKNYLNFMGIYDTVRNNTLVGVFFLVNIFLAVIGTFWLRISKRKSELALRMATGADRKTILFQLLSESYILFLIGFIPAMIVCVNMINTDVISVARMDFTIERFFWDTLLTFAIFFTAITLATIYPAYRSSQIQPAEALRDE